MIVLVKKMSIEELHLLLGSFCQSVLYFYFKIPEIPEIMQRQQPFLCKSNLCFELRIESGTQSAR